MEKSNILLGHIYEGLELLHTSRQDNDIHVSNLIDFCPRAFMLCRHKNLMYNEEQNFPGRRLMTFQVGHAVEKIILDALRATKISRHTPPLHINLTKDIKIIGTPDGSVVISLDGTHLIELKTTGKDEIEQMSEPYINHVCQLSLYLWMAEIRKAPYIYTDGFVIYVSKLEKKEGIKIYHINRNEAFIQRVRTQLLALKTFSEQDELPPRICNSPNAMMAKNHCTISKLCFQEAG